MLRPEDIAGWTPIALDLDGPTPSIDWGDLRGMRFAEPFFQQTVERWAGGASAALIRTDLGALRRLDGADSLDPSALIFHLSRCGSTLLARLLGSVPGVLVVSEPAPLNTLLADGTRSESEQADLLRLLVRALGRRRFGDERHYVLKLSSWNVAKLALFRRAFPATPLFWLQRAPVEVLASLLRQPPGWRRLARDPAAEALFGSLPRRSRGDDPDLVYVDVMAALLRAAAGEPDACCLDYRDLPEAGWTEVAPRMGLALEAAEIARMRELARYDAKRVEAQPFTPPQTQADALPPALAAALAQEVEPFYRRLDDRRIGRA